MKTTLIITDEVNVQFHGLQKKHILHIIDKTKIYIKGAHHTAAVKLGISDGKESQFNDDGTTFLFMLPIILPILEDIGYTVDVKDNRQDIPFFADYITAYFLNEYGINLRPYQIDTTNTIIKEQQGLIEIATSGGKTIIIATIAKLYDNAYRTLVIVPKDNLVTQTIKAFNSIGLDVGKISGTIKNKEEQWKKRHVISTWQSLNKNRQYLSNFNIVLYDECHIIGDVMFKLFINELSQAHIRVGFSGTIPKDKHKKQKICCRIGGDIIKKVSPKELQDDGFISTLDIDIFPIEHEIVLPDKEWETEFAYLNTNIHRIRTIADFILGLKKENTLILTHPQLGKKLSGHLHTDFIDKNVHPKKREVIYEKYDTIKNYTCVASYETVGTGISIDNIQRLIIIDSGKNPTRILQSIGRGLRLDDKTNHLKVLDLYAQLIKQNKKGDTVKHSFSTLRHLSERKGIYKKNKFPFIEIKEIMVYDKL